MNVNQTYGNVDIDQLKREISDLKKRDKEMKKEILSLNSRLEDEKSKNVRSESLLELRGEYIKTLQETDEVNKARLVLHIKEVEDLRAKVTKAKKFKAASLEEFNNLQNTLKSQEFEIKQLQHDLKAKEEKLLKYKSKLNSVDKPENL